ncbi:MAG: AAA family ATPase [Planctomycetota bacterium]|nr:AAA family ATPase [Planctomycetota bacterium]
MSTDDKTLELLRALVASQPENAEARAHLATLLLDAGRAEEALALLDEAPASGQGVEDPLLRGRVLEAADPRRAIEHYRAVVAADRRNAAAHMALARLYRESGLREDARHHYGIAVVIDEALEDAEFDDWIHGGSAGEPPPPRPLAPPPTPAPAPDDAVEDAPSVEDLQETLDLDGTPAPKLPKLTFDDVGGMDAVKEQIRMRVVYPFRNPKLFEKFKKKPGGGILLYGPPGCGKTYLARATAGECNARFVSVGVADILSRWLGESEQRLQELFAEARRRAPTVIFIDELDALGMSRREARGSALKTVINQLLTELDGVGSDNRSVLVLAATNAPWNVDTAFRRPGRFDRVVFVPPPDGNAREAILRLNLTDVPHEEPDYKKLRSTTKRWSGADLRELVERAAEVAIQEEMRTGRETLITRKMLAKAAKTIRPTTVEWLNTAKNYASYANRAGQYDDVADFFQSDAD